MCGGEALVSKGQERLEIQVLLMANLRSIFEIGMSDRDTGYVL